MLVLLAVSWLTFFTLKPQIVQTLFWPGTWVLQISFSMHSFQMWYFVQWAFHSLSLYLSLPLSLSLSLPLSSPIYGQGTIVFSKDIKIYSREWRGWGLSPLIKRENVIRLTRGTLQVGFVCCFSYYASPNMIFLTFCHSRRNLIWS